MSKESLVGILTGQLHSVVKVKVLVSYAGVVWRYASFIAA